MGPKIIPQTYFYKQHKELKVLVEKNQLLQDVLYQGKPLSWHASDFGLQKLLEAVEQGILDPIALNHGIKRYRIDKYNSDLIWDYANIRKSVSYDDAFIIELSENFAKIKCEVIQVLDQVKKFPDSDDLTNQSGQWNFIPFYERDGKPVSMLLDRCPTIARLLENQDINTDLGFVFVSSLTAHSSIAAHTGSTSFRKRYHFPIIVPEVGKSKIRVGSDWIAWEPGKAFSFYDAVEHEVIHDASGDRVLLIVDVWPEYMSSELIRILKSNKWIFGYATENQASVAIND